MQKKKKYYVVWNGVVPGVYSTWDDCKKQILNFPKAQYKSFGNLNDAQAAFNDPAHDHLQASSKSRTKTPKKYPPHVQINSIAVDAACSGNPGKMEYRGVHISSGTEIFRQGPYEQGTNNIGEFLAIVHAMAWMTKHNKIFPIYSDSTLGIKWIKAKKANTKLSVSPQNKQLFDIITRAENWLKTHDTRSFIVEKWNTKEWGEIPADFGRK